LYGQATPTAVATPSSSLSPSFGGPITDGEVHYSLSAGEIISHGLFSGSGTETTTNLSGAAGYSSRSERLPFSMIYSGGVLISTMSGQTFQTFQNASLAQQFITPRWVFGVSDSVSYLPQSPTTGYSGIAGVGDLGPLQGPGQGPAGGILTNYGKRVSNSLDGNLERKLTASTSIVGSADYSILRFIDGVGLDTTGITGTVGLNHRWNARTTIGAEAVYSIFTYGTYPGVPEQLSLSGLSFQTRGINLVFQRLLTHNLSVSASAGPQLVNSSNETLSPSVTTGAGSIGLSYTHRLTTASLTYVRGANGGSGVQQGTISDSISASVNRSYGRDWQAAITGSYTRSSGLIKSQAINQLLGIAQTYDSFYGGLQITRRLGMHTTGYFSYTVQAQNSSSSTVPNGPNVFSGVGNIFSLGVTWAPRATSLARLF